MKKEKKHPVFARLGAVALALGVAVSFYAVAVSAGTESDPLVTLSYLNGPFTEKVMSEVDKLSGQTGGGDAYTVVTLSAGQQLTLSAGAEVLLRSGTAACAAATDPGMVDTTGGSVLDGLSKLKENHLYIVTQGGQGLKASTAVTVMVRGGYSIS